MKKLSTPTRVSRAGMQASSNHACQGLVCLRALLVLLNRPDVYSTTATEHAP